MPVMDSTGQSASIRVRLTTVNRRGMVRLAGKLQRPQKFMSGTNFYFCHVINKRYARSEKQYGDIVKFATIQLAVRKY